MCLFWRAEKHSVEVVAVGLKGVLHVWQRLENVRMLWPRNRHKSQYISSQGPVWKLANKFSSILLEHTQEKKSLKALSIGMFMYAQRKKLACSSNQRELKDNINYDVCLVVAFLFLLFTSRDLQSWKPKVCLSSCQERRKKKRSFKGTFHQVQFLPLKLTLLPWV